MGIAELQTIDQRELERFGREFGQTVRGLPFQLPENFLLLIRTISLISGVTSALDKDFNMWDAVDPFARTILSSGGAGVLRDLPQQALQFASTVARLPRRMDEIIDQLERGKVALRTPDVDRRLRSLERTIGRAVSAIVFAALLFAGVLLRPTDEVLGWVLMAASAIPLLHVVFTWRSGSR
jgi:predicted unusual protein kinase regulating ubiquinone biosynthesis (AarF/ABC1/UbiB family)